MTGFDEFQRANWDSDQMAQNAARYRAAIEDALTTLEGISGQAVEAVRVILRSALNDGRNDA